MEYEKNQLVRVIERGMACGKRSYACGDAECLNKIFPINKVWKNYGKVELKIPYNTGGRKICGFRFDQVAPVLSSLSHHCDKCKFKREKAKIITCSEKKFPDWDGCKWKKKA